MKKLITLFLIILITGCTKYNDLRELTIIKSIGITYTEKYTIYAQIIDHIDKDNNPIMKTIPVDGNNIEECFTNLKNKISKDIYLAHIDLLVLEDALTNSNYQDIINYFISNNSFRNDFYCIFSPNAKSLLEKSNYDEIEMFLKTNKKNNKLVIKNFDAIVKEFIDDSKITLPNIDYNEKISYLGDIEYQQKENNYVQKN